MENIFYKSKLEFLSIFVFLIAVFVLITVNIGAEETTGGIPIDLEPLGNELEIFDNSSGTYFQVIDSEYLNVSIASTENVFISLYSIPNIVSYTIESDSIENNTNLFLSGFEPNKVYYFYENGNLQFEFTTDSGGNYTYNQDISINHFISIKEEISTIYINSDGTVTGAPSGAITFDSTLSYYDLNFNINTGIVIQRSGITFNGNGNSVTGSGGYGIELASVYGDVLSGVTVKNTIITGWSIGVIIGVYAYDNTIMNCTIMNNYYGIWGNDRSHHNDIVGNTIDSNTYYGITLSQYTKYYLLSNIRCQNSND